MAAARLEGRELLFLGLADGTRYGGAKNEKKSRGLEMALGGMNPQTIVYLLLFTSMTRIYGYQL